MIGPDGQRWWTTTRASEQLGVQDSRIRDWVRRSKAAGHVAGASKAECEACGRAGFPHVDPPRRSGAIAVYLADQLLDAEAHTAGSRRGAPRDA